MRIQLNQDYAYAHDGIHITKYRAGEHADLPELTALLLADRGMATLCDLTVEDFETAVAVPVAQKPAWPKRDLSVVAKELTKLHGVGPKLGAALAEAGVTGFEDLAELGTNPGLFLKLEEIDGVSAGSLESWSHEASLILDED